MQLAKKIIETRQRYSLENIPWKKKILKSLEGVLMKRLRKLEKDTGLKADLLDGVNLEPDQCERQKVTKTKKEQTTNKTNKQKNDREFIATKS